jgi:MraZ protein
MLIGEYIHTLDDKNRLALPVKFRIHLGKRVVLSPGLDGCIFVFTKDQWRDISAKLSAVSLLKSDTRSFNRFIFGGAVEVEVDSVGRILIPEFLTKRSKLSSRVAIIGVDNRVEIWDEQAWNVYKNNVENQADALAERLGEVGVL